MEHNNKVAEVVLAYKNNQGGNTSFMKFASMLFDGLPFTMSFWPVYEWGSGKIRDTTKMILHAIHDVTPINDWRNKFASDMLEAIREG